MSAKNGRPEIEKAKWDGVRSWTEDHDHSSTLDPDEAVLVRELRDVGVPLRRLEEFANVKLIYHDALPILLKHLRRPHSDFTKGSLYRILTFKPAPIEVHDALVDELRCNSEQLSRQPLFWLGDAIVQTAPRGSLDSVLEVASTPKYREARVVPIEKLAKSWHPSARDVIGQYFAEGSNLPTAIRALRLAKMWDYADRVEAFANSSNFVVRDEARKFLRSAKLRSP